MMNQESYVNIEDLHKQGWTIKEIAAETGYHPATISRRLREGPPPARRVAADGAKVMTRRWAERIEALVGEHPRLLGISVWRCLGAEGFAGSYATVTRELRRIRGPRFCAADRVSVPIFTEPGEEAQFDWCDLDAVARRWGWGTRLVCFGMILCWSRRRIWWFATSEDRNHTFEGAVRFFEAVGGVPAVCRTDRMGALGSSQGSRFVLCPAAVGFAAHHSTRIAACRAGDAKRKGKVERPFRQLRETFLPELEAQGPPESLGELNRRAAVWLDAHVHAVESRSTGARPAERHGIERPFLSALPTQRFDTDYVQARRVHNILPFVAIDGVRYSVPPETLGQLTEVRRPVGAQRFEVRWAGRLVAAHSVVAGRGADVWDPAHRQAAEAAAMAHRPPRPVLRLVASPAAPQHGHLDVGEGFDVDPVDLSQRYPLTLNNSEARQ